LVDGRANEIAEHDRQLAALGVVLLSWLGRCHGLRRRRRRASKLPDRPQHPAAMTERDV
jgi:hypothetical protein